MAADKIIDRELHGAHAAIFIEALGIDETAVAADDTQLIEQEQIGASGFGEPGVDQHAIAID